MLLLPLIRGRLAIGNLLSMHNPAVGELDRSNHGAFIATVRKKFDHVLHGNLVALEVVGSVINEVLGSFRVE